MGKNQNNSRIRQTEFEKSRRRFQFKAKINASSHQKVISSIRPDQMQKKKVQAPSKILQESEIRLLDTIRENQNQLKYFKQTWRQKMEALREYEEMMKKAAREKNWNEFQIIQEQCKRLDKNCSELQNGIKDIERKNVELRKYMELKYT